ncbi:MAG: alpha/beta hydrolase [Actinobacteria bacterium]|nr:alpha/beta hydrolase [Actinomycetota bacterium]
MSYRERVVPAGDAELLLREWGTDGPPIVFWHALGDHTSLQMIEAGPILAEEFGYRVVGVDAPGFGGSPRVAAERYRMPALVDLAENLLDRLDFDRPVWAGSSWGGIVGVHFAATHPERLAALVLVDGGYQGQTIPEGETLEQMQTHWRAQPGFEFDSWQAVIEASRDDFEPWSPEIETYVRSAYREQNGRVVSIMGPDVFSAALHGIDWAPFPLPALSKGGVPTLLLAAGDSPKPVRRMQRERFAEYVPHAEIRVMDGVPHLMFEARPEETARAIGDWLKSLPYP